jgi:hypothetical protein
MLALPSCILVDTAVAHVVAGVVEEEPAAIMLTMCSTPATATCPVCALPAQRIQFLGSHDKAALVVVEELGVEATASARHRQVVDDAGGGANRA